MRPVSTSAAGQAPWTTLRCRIATCTLPLPIVARGGQSSNQVLRPVQLAPALYR